MVVQLTFDVRRLHDAGHFQQYRIVSQPLTHQRGKHPDLADGPCALAQQPLLGQRRFRLGARDESLTQV